MYKPHLLPKCLMLLEGANDDPSKADGGAKGDEGAGDIDKPLTADEMIDALAKDLDMPKEELLKLKPQGIRKEIWADNYYSLTQTEEGKTIFEKMARERFPERFADNKPEPKMEQNLLNFIKYCLGYVRLTRQRTFAAQQKYAVDLSQRHFNLEGLLNGDIDGSLGELINLETFYSYDPKNVPEHARDKYEQEKVLANKIEEIYNKYRNDQFTKQNIFSFGYFEIELPLEIEEASIDIEVEEVETANHSERTKIERYPLFSLPVKIEKEFEKGVDKYFLYFVDPEVQVNVGLLEPVLGEDSYYQLVEKLGRYEMEGKLTLPITELDIFVEIWHKIKAQLRLTEAIFDENSFSLSEMSIALSPRANYFLAEDLLKLSKLNEEEVEETALSSWVNDDQLNEEIAIPHEKDLYFPFRFDKYQLRVLSILNNKVAIVQGPPGTGKSETISNLLCHLAANGNRVLFVSQKTQALKVVKDKLKKLGVKYLFGYIPNPASAQTDEDDEIDGIAPQLTAIYSHIEKLSYKLHRGKGLFEYQGELKEDSAQAVLLAVEEKIKLQELLNDLIEAQRKYYQLHEELMKMTDFDIAISDITCFRMNFTFNEWQKIKELQKKISDLVRKTEEYEILEERRMYDKLFAGVLLSENQYSEIIQLLHKELESNWDKIGNLQGQIKLLTKEIIQYQYTEEKEKFDNLFPDLNLSERNYANEVQTLRNDVTSTAYDRYSRVLRKWNNFRRKLRLRDLRSRMPCEIINYIDKVLDQDISRSEATRKLNSLHRYFFYYEQCKDLALGEGSIISILSSILEIYRDKLPNKLNDSIKEKMIRVDVIKEEVDDILESLYRYCKYCENIKSKENIEKDLGAKLNTCGISEKEFQIIDILVSKVQSSEFEDIKCNILRVREIKEELRKIAKSQDLNFVSSSLKATGKNRCERIALYLQNIVNQKIIEKWKQGVKIRQIIQKFARAFGRSRRAFKTFDNLRKDPDNFNEILDLIPIWIMELDDASRIIPLGSAIFDYVVLDEASQCNVAYTLPVMFRAKRTLFVGDSEQMRDSTIIFKAITAFDELAHRYQMPEELQIKATGSAVQSVLDIAALRGFQSIPLRYHYRSPAELIGFSNKYFYVPKGKELIPVSANYLIYKDTNRILVFHEVKSDWNDEFSDKVNVAEAKEILNLFKELRNNKIYEDKSVGILSFFNAQATYIRTLFETEGFKEEIDNYKVSIIEGIQGDEKDIIIYSFVIRHPDQKNKYVPLTGEGGDIQADINKGRVNVAFSRARLQVHVFTSLGISEMPGKIWLKKYLEYVRDNGEINFFSTELKPFDSHFEEEFYYFMRANLKNGYRIQNQVKSCGFKIDFVISNKSNEKCLAVECDGPTHFKDEIDEAYGIYAENDEERQRILEDARWKFYRIKYSDWINNNFDKRKIIEDILSILQ